MTKVKSNQKLSPTKVFFPTKVFVSLKIRSKFRFSKQAAVYLISLSKTILYWTKHSQAKVSKFWRDD